MIELVRNFIKSGEGRTRDVVPSLYALIGYVVSLPAYALKALFPANLPGTVICSLHERTERRKLWDFSLTVTNSKIT